MGGQRTEREAKVRGTFDLSALLELAGLVVAALR
jgi:hypothetical protein